MEIFLKSNVFVIFLLRLLCHEFAYVMSTCVVQSVKLRTSDLDVTGSRPGLATRHIR